MSLQKRTAGLGGLAMFFACLFLLLVSTGVSSSHAQTVDSPSKQAGTIEGEDGVDLGDPDMPTGDLPPPSGGSGSTSTGYDGGVYRGHATTGGVTEVVQTKRWGWWSHWQVALKLMARNLFIAR